VRRKIVMAATQASMDILIGNWEGVRGRMCVWADKADSKEGSEWTNPYMGYCAMGGKISIEESMNHYEI
jgi:hypothetical protein